MRKTLFGLLLLAFTLVQAASQNWAGSWAGDLALPMGKLKLIIHLTSNDGKWSATLDSPMPGAKGLPVSSVIIERETLKLVANNLGLAYTATLTGDKMTGTFSQGGMKLPLTLEREIKKTLEATALPYAERELVVDAHPEGIRLVGTLTRPKGAEGRLPLIIFITGSGPQNRDEELMGHKPFAVLADSLTRAGFMTYRYDDRGVGKSTGEYWRATLSSFVVDALSVLRYMSKLAEVDPSCIYLLGHSEGGYIAACVAKLEPKVGAVISMAGPAEPFREVLVSQLDKMNELAKLPQELREANRRVNTKAYKLAADPKLSKEILASKLEILLKEHLATTNLLPEVQRSKFIETTIAQVSSDYFREFARTDPAETWRAVRCPIIAFFGSKDVQVLPSNAKRLGQLAPKARIKVFDGLNHLMQPANTGSVQEYAQITTTISPEVVQWIIDELKRL